MGWLRQDGPRLFWFPSRIPIRIASPDERYKGLGSRHRRRTDLCLLALKSPDGIHWSRMSDKAAITKGEFDSQNLAFLGLGPRRIPRLLPRLPRWPAGHPHRDVAGLHPLERAGLARIPRLAAARALHEPDRPLLPGPPHLPRLSHTLRRSRLDAIARLRCPSWSIASSVPRCRRVTARP